MTKVQRKVLVDVYEKLEKAFPHFVIITSEIESEDDNIQIDPNLLWFGGHIMAKHIINDAVDKVLRRKFNNVRPKE
jgi:hypothetical protein